LAPQLDESVIASEAHAVEKEAETGASKARPGSKATRYWRYIFIDVE